LAGIDLNKVRNRHVLDAVVELSTKPDGFTVGKVAAVVRERTGWSATKYSSRHAGYDLAKLQGKKLVRRPARSRCYVADPRGVRTMCAFVVLREKVIKPLLAGVVRPYGRPPKTVNALDQHYVNLREELHHTFDTFGLAA
jgi:DNA-binding transcriptional ArsR family regulator